ALFLASLGALLIAGALPLLPGQEQRARERLREASRRMADEAAAAGTLPPAAGAPPPEVSRRLREVAENTLADYPGVEGGFYLGASDTFTAYAFPTETRPEPPGPNPSAPRTDPPPKEEFAIRGQAKQSLAAKPGEFLASVQDIGPSRVAFLSEPVGDGRP